LLSFHFLASFTILGKKNPHSFSENEVHKFFKFVVHFTPCRSRRISLKVKSVDENIASDLSAVKEKVERGWYFGFRRRQNSKSITSAPTKLKKGASSKANWATGRLFLF
jgi:hypothetical protein